MKRVDFYPTHRHGDFLLRAGRPYPFGASFVPGGVNFAIFSRYASVCALVLFEKGELQPLVEIPFPTEFQIGHVFAMIVFDLDYENIEYGYRMDGLYRPHEGHHFNQETILLDPYARAVNGRSQWAAQPTPNNPYPHRALLPYDDFDWVDDHPLEKPPEDLIVYEMHVRGFTRHPSSGAKYAGTFAAIREKIPYLKDLGVNCIELMPIFEFDELENKFISPLTGAPLVQYWGYDSINFFAPKAGYAATGRYGMQMDEFKALVKELHKHDIEVFLDVAFNHTGEGGEDGRTISYRGIDNKTYYMLRPDGSYQNFSGCGNTMNCNNPVVRNMVLDCLRYWVAEYHIDGFRFDLASILGRDSAGRPLANPPLLEAMAHDPVLGKTKLIAEAWDAAGLYQVGSFPAYGRWGEWNGKYRDCLRRFLKGDEGQVAEIAQRIQGSPDLYTGRGTTASINFVTAHDGFTLADLFSYNEKHNLANGEDNHDGQNDNYSWNCGWEGSTDNPEINALRQRMIKNAIAILLVSQGVPMILMGDEVGHTKNGNNNTYGHDNELNWFDWTRLESNAELYRFFRNCITFRKVHTALRNQAHFRHEDYVGSGYPDISFHGVEAWQPDWAYHSHTLAFMLDGEHARGGLEPDDTIYVAMNMHWEDHQFSLPRLPVHQKWHTFVNTSVPHPNDICTPDKEPVLANQKHLLIAARSVVILVGR
ncbi:MAG: glycogen debranching protein GlgX [Ardenticatenaceae bacterium]|nr:glycogen debranching protein GlgX [Anaerolineales bacterium]MCB8923719.1 glycogen debranching protein GlgX [Ardenticatenaceae bacterium]MCB9005711.1 glycogen debranching protein GlgX [Ardenticatenaceae bacterium]